LDAVWEGCTMLSEVSLGMTACDETHMWSNAAMPVCKSLRVLELDRNEFKYLSAIAECTNLEKLMLQQNWSVEDLAPLAGLTRLKDLCLSRQWDDEPPSCGVVDVSALAFCTALTNLDLSYQNNIVDVSALAALTDLTALDLSGTGVSDVSALALLSALPRLLTYAGPGESESAWRDTRALKKRRV